MRVGVSIALVAVGLLIAAVVFGLFHALAAADGIAVYVAYATLQGLVLGYAYVATDNLVVVALAHGVFDAAINVVSFFQI